MSKILIDKIIEDIRGRSGIGNSWQEIDEETQKEIKGTWEGMVAEAFYIQRRKFLKKYEKSFL